jgi:hypothetical protein
MHKSSVVLELGITLNINTAQWLRGGWLSHSCRVALVFPASKLDIALVRIPGAKCALSWFTYFWALDISPQILIGWARQIVRLPDLQSPFREEATPSGLGETNPPATFLLIKIWVIGGTSQKSFTKHYDFYRSILEFPKKKKNRRSLVSWVSINLSWFTIMQRLRTLS